MKTKTDLALRHAALKEALCDSYGEGIVLLEPEHYDEAIVGISHEERLIYSYEKLIDALIEYDGMSYEDAVEWISYNTIRAIPYMGPNAPIIMFSPDEILGSPAASKDNE